MRKKPAKLTWMNWNGVYEGYVDSTCVARVDNCDECFRAVVYAVDAIIECSPNRLTLSSAQSWCVRWARRAGLIA